MDEEKHRELLIDYLGSWEGMEGIQKLANMMAEPQQEYRILKYLEKHFDGLVDVYYIHAGLLEKMKQ